MPAWQKLIDHLDDQGENRVRLAVEVIGEIVGSKLAEGAWYGPTRKGLSDYWRSSHVLPDLRAAGWTVDFTDYVEKNVGFCRLSQTGEDLEQVGSLAATIQNLVRQAHHVGRVTSIVTTKSLEDGTSITLSIDPGDQGRGDVPQEHSQTRQVSPERTQTRQVSPERPIQRLPSTEASSDSIRYDDDSMVRWPVGRSENNRRGFLRAVRRHVTDIREGQGLGGYGCLATMSQKKSAQTKTVAIYSPAALGLRRVQGNGALFAVVIQQKVAIMSISGHGHHRDDSIRMELRNKTDKFVRFLIPRRTVFEQEAPDPEAQDLMLRDTVDGVLSPNETRTIKAHGLCMDADRESPEGQNLLLTPWLLSTEVVDQSELWKVTEGAPAEDDLESLLDDCSRKQVAGIVEEVGVKSAKTDKSSLIKALVSEADEDEVRKALAALSRKGRRRARPVAGRSATSVGPSSSLG